MIENDRKSVSAYRRNFRGLTVIFAILAPAVIIANLASYYYLGYVFWKIPGFLLAASLGSVLTFANLLKQAKEDAENHKNLLMDKLKAPGLPKRIAVFAITKINAGTLDVGQDYFILTPDYVDQIDANGQFPLGKYNELGTLLVEESGELDFHSRALDHQYWMRARRQHRISDEIVSRTLAHFQPQVSGSEFTVDGSIQTPK